MYKKSFSLTQDWKANKGNAKGIVILFLFRAAHLATIHKLLFIVMLPYLIFYRIMVEWFLGVELPYKVKIGKGLRLFHAHALVINKDVIIGENCTIRQTTTIGNKENADGSFSACPKIGNHVDIGSNACILGNIEIGDNVKIGAGSVVVKSVPANVIIAGNPAKLIRPISTEYQ
ncbi:serine acetyltransferase [Mucilaginibacter sp. ZB1P21]|uniref:Serine acetyltransferase n=2 Tax=Mucilaginibacter glaciei TaxID=2772109 RepID=A0A926S1Z5_9SPHI|nr:serine acetyltransferase [Mucilaginibacter glaciei]